MSTHMNQMSTQILNLTSTVRKLAEEKKENCCNDQSCTKKRKIGTAPYEMRNIKDLTNASDSDLLVEDVAGKYPVGAEKYNIGSNNPSTIWPTKIKRRAGSF